MNYLLFRLGKPVPGALGGGESSGIVLVPGCPWGEGREGGRRQRPGGPTHVYLGGLPVKYRGGGLLGELAVAPALFPPPSPQKLLARVPRNK